MSGENNLQTLLENMRPDLKEDSYLFITSPDGFSSEIQSRSLMIFKELEGMTLIIKKEIADTLHQDHQPQWAMITLTIHSDLQAVGFLAPIMTRLAEAGISVNPVSAFYHDHLFVPWDKRNEAMEILESFKS